MWEFARGCMRTYLILAERARELDADPAFREALAAAQVPELAQPTVGAVQRAGRRGRCARRRSTSTRWRRAAPGTSAWTSCSSSG